MELFFFGSIGNIANKIYMFFVETVQAAGTIASAPTIAEVLLKALDFLLAVVAIVAILALVFSGIMYFFAGGDRKRIDRAKTMTFASITGIAIALGSMVVIHLIAGFFK